MFNKTPKQIQTRGGRSGLGSLLGSLLMIGTFASSGCFLHTSVVYPPPADPVSGYYLTQAQSVSYGALLNTGATTVTGSVNALPAYAASIFTNPLGVQLDSPGASTGVLFSG